ncbi:MAG: hypothetical protein GC151_10225 [Betaproteobacteria bacterium]|nr:hypothetical protein [Betaproteobacteria bacterium]
MAERPEEQMDVEMNASDLYREETVTDRRVGTIRVLQPITKDGSPDPSRSAQYIGEAQIMTSVGALPLNFELPGDSLAAAVDAYGAAAKDAVERAMRELQEMRRQAASSIVVPQGPGAMGGGGGFGPGGLGGPGRGGKLQMP